jgi:hypothetical protein
MTHMFPGIPRGGSLVGIYTANEKSDLPSSYIYVDPYGKSHHGTL